MTMKESSSNILMLSTNRMDDMTPDHFRAWLAEQGLSVRRAAAALGVSPATVQDLSAGYSRTSGKPVAADKRTALACAAIAAKLAPWEPQKTPK